MEIAKQVNLLELDLGSFLSQVDDKKEVVDCKIKG